MKRPRLPTDEERALWRETTRHDAKFKETDKPPKKEENKNSKDTRNAATAASRSGGVNAKREGASPLSAQSADRKKPLTAGDTNHTDRNTARRLKRGELPIEATLDLHGHTREEAYTLLKRRMGYWTKHGKRCVCIITGKGRLNEGVLKRELPAWLNEPYLRAHIIAFTPAPLRMGGEGAVLVLLRRMR